MAPELVKMHFMHVEGKVCKWTWAGCASANSGTTTTVPSLNTVVMSAVQAAKSQHKDLHTLIGFRVF